MKLKHVLFAALFMPLAFTSTAQDFSETWDYEIDVKSGTDKFDGEQMHCYSTTIFETKEGAVRDLVMDEIKMRTEEKPSKKKVMSALQIDLPKIDAEGVGVKVKTDENKKSETVTCSVAFILDSVAINPKDFPEADKAAKEVMRELGVILNQSVVGVQIAETQKELDLLEKKKESYMKDKEKLEKVASQGEDKLASLAADKRKLEEKLIKAQTKSASSQVAAEASTSTSKDLNKYANAKKSVTDIEGKILKNNEAVKKMEEKMAEAEDELPGAMKTLEESAAAIEVQKALLEKLQVKYDAIK